MEQDGLNIWDEVNAEEDRELAKRPFSDHEKECTKILVEEVIREKNHTEKRWKVIASRLEARYAIDRTVRLF